MGQYSHGGDIYGNIGVLYDFSVNTNPLGMPQEIKDALIKNIDQYSAYPDPKTRDLVREISLHEKVKEEYILCGNGAADLIYRLCYAIRPKRALILAPTFSEYEKALVQVGSTVSYYHLKEENDFVLDEGILSELNSKPSLSLDSDFCSDIDILFLCQPNNPTGRLIEKGLLESILKLTRDNNIIVVMDECFLDFTNEESTVSYISSMDNIIVLKAFTKMYSMAGLRLGYMMTSNMDILDKSRDAAQHWSVSIPAQVAGIAALSCVAWQEENRRIVKEERDFLMKSLKSLGVKAYLSDCNFILLYSFLDLYSLLLDKGILIRSCKNFIGLNEKYFRVCVKNRQANIYLIESLKEILNG